MKIAINQSNYIPWKGYFDIIASADLFIIFDDAQFTKNDWRNRNKIKTASGTKWLSIPVGKNIKRKIYDVGINNQWQKKHWSIIETNYQSSKYYREISDWLKPLYFHCIYDSLSEVNKAFITSICKYLEITTRIVETKDYKLAKGRSNKLVDLCIQSNATHYITGPSAKNYLDLTLFDKANIKVEWMDYNEYEKYDQLWGTFDHNVSIIDLLFNCGLESKNYLKKTSL